MRTVALGVVACLLGTAGAAHADLLSRGPTVGDAPGGGGGTAPPPPDDDLAAWAGPAQPTSLPALLQHAVTQAPSLASARLDVAIAEARIEQTWARDDWRIGAQLSAAWQRGFVTSGFRIDSFARIALNTELSRTLPTGGTLTLHATSEYQNFDTVLGQTTSWFDEVGGTITQPLLRGRGRWLFEANERRANLARDAAALARRLAAIQTVQQVVSAYWDLVLAERQVAITQASLLLARERLRITQIGADGGRVPRSEIPAVQQIIATREEEVLNGELLVVDRSIALRRAVGLPIGPGALALRVGTDLETRDAAWNLGAPTERAYAASPELAQLAKQAPPRASTSRSPRTGCCRRSRPCSRSRRPARTRARAWRCATSSRSARCASRPRCGSSTRSARRTCAAWRARRARPAASSA